MLHDIFNMFFLCVTRCGLHGALWAGTETGALQELATCHPEWEKVQTHLLWTQRTVHQQWVQFGGHFDVFSLSSSLHVLHCLFSPFHLSSIFILLLYLLHLFLSFKLVTSIDQFSHAQSFFIVNCLSLSFYFLILIYLFCWATFFFLRIMVFIPPL